MTMTAQTSTAGPVFFCHDKLDHAGIRHWFFTRKGGASGGLYNALHCGLGSDDDRAVVRENRARVAAAMGLGPDHMRGMSWGRQCVCLGDAYGQQRPVG